MTYLLNNQALDPGSADGQHLLSQAYGRRERPVCDCAPSRPEMYIAFVGERYILKRMPSSGADHAPGCASFLPPEELSGLSQVQGSAIEEHPEDGVTILKLDFALRKNNKSMAPPEISESTATEVKPPAKKLTLTSLLHYLWHEADLVKWVPAMEGKRSWGVVHRALLRAAAGKIAKNAPIANRVFVPEPYRQEKKADIAARRARRFNDLKGLEGSGTQLGILVAEYKTHEATRLGAKFIFKHMPDCSFFGDEDFRKRFEKVFEAPLNLADMAEAHPMVIATFSFAKAGYPVLHEAGMMLVSKTWIPFEHMREVELIEAMTSGRRSFLKSMRFNLDKTTPIASMVATDLVRPVSMFVSSPDASADETAALINAADEGTYPFWYWLDDRALSALPTDALIEGQGGKG